MAPRDGAGPPLERKTLAFVVATRSSEDQYSPVRSRDVGPETYAGPRGQNSDHAPELLDSPFEEEIELGRCGQTGSFLCLARKRRRLGRG